jgi:hypothetical protein
MGTIALKPWTLPSNYAGMHWHGYLMAPVMRNRDSDHVTESNWAHQLKVLRAVDETQEALDWENAHDLDTEAWEIVSENHWACGWVEWVAVHPEAKAWIAALEKLAYRLDQYPIADETDLGEREMTAAQETWANFSVRDRVEVLKRCGSKVSIFAARRSEVPSDDCGRINDYLLGY